jgi:cell division protein FtsB
MPSASATASRTAGSASRRTTSTARGARTTYDAGERTSRPAARSGRARRPRVRWDRLARVVMMCVLGVLLYLYVSAGTSILTTWRSSVHHRAQLATLSAQNHRLQAQRAVLARPSTIVAEARRLGMVRPGEQAYVVRNLPGD